MRNYSSKSESQSTGRTHRKAATTKKKATAKPVGDPPSIEDLDEFVIDLVEDYRELTLEQEIVPEPISVDRALEIFNEVNKETKND